MNDKVSKSTLDNGKQSVGDDSRNKRNSGLFSFFKWLKPSGSASRESLSSDKANNNNSSSCESLSSVQSSGTVASFSYVEPSAYAKNLTEKNIDQAPETDTYRGRLKQRDNRREKDKNTTLRKKYNLFFYRDTLLKNVSQNSEESTKSLPLMTKPTMKEEPKEEGLHRRTNSDSSKIKKAGAYLHVKGKRKAPQPPGLFEDSSTTSFRRTNKRLAPPPPEKDKETKPNISEEKLKPTSANTNKPSFDFPLKKTNASQEIPISTAKKNENTYTFLQEQENKHTSNSINNETTQSKLNIPNERITKNSSSFVLNSDLKIEKDDAINKKKEETTVSENIPNQLNNSEIISNDFLKLDHGILKPVKEDEQNIYSECSPFISKNSTDSSKPWYKRNETNANLKREFLKIRHENHEKSVERLPEVSFNRNSTIELTSNRIEQKKDIKMEKKKEDKRKSGLSLLANISELDREAAEILQKEKMKQPDKFKEIPVFMKPKEDNNNTNNDSWVSPKRRSARDLIAKFNAITNVTKVTVNTALFGSHKKEYFEKSSPKATKKHQEAMLESHKKRIEMIDKKLNSEKKMNHPIPLMKSESVSLIKKPETPKSERKTWNCPKCFIENEYWRIICHVCSAIKPYFDDLAASPNLRKNERSYSPHKQPNQNQYERVLERSKTQIGFSALTHNSQNDKKTDKQNSGKSPNKEIEKEKLKKMLIEMKNSLPKRSSFRDSATRSSIILEKPETEEKGKIPQETSDEESESSDTDNEDIRNNSPTLQCGNILQKEKKELNFEEQGVSLLIGTKETIYENIKVRKTSDPKPLKVSSWVQTSSVVPKPPEPSKRANITAMVKKKNSFEPMKVQDFNDIYSDQDGKSAARIYANLARNDELSLFFNMPKNLTEMKNTLSKMKLQNKNRDTIEINRLLRRLEIAIAKGDMTQAADFAKELAQLKVNCSVVRQRSDPEQKNTGKGGFSVDMFVEDQISHRGPFPLEVTPEQTVGELKIQIEREFDIPTNVQRWILGKELAISDKTTLRENNVTAGCAIFLYLVAPDVPDLAPQKKSDEQIKEQNVASSSTMNNMDIKTKEVKIELTKTPQNIEENSEVTTKMPSKLYPNIESSISEIYSKGDETLQKESGPKIINAIPKVTQSTSKFDHNSEIVTDKEMLNVSPGPSNSSMDKCNIENFGTPEKHLFSEVVTQTVTTVLQAPNLHLAQPEDIEEFDSNTLKPERKQLEEWECHLCTLLNPMKSNICGVCATVRQNPPKKVNRKNLVVSPNAPLESSNGQTYQQLMNLDNEDLVHNLEPFECVICFVEVPSNQGVTLRECLHQFCKECLRVFYRVALCIALFSLTLCIWYTSTHILLGRQKG